MAKTASIMAKNLPPVFANIRDMSSNARYGENGKHLAHSYRDLFSYQICRGHFWHPANLNRQSFGDSWPFSPLHAFMDISGTVDET